MSLVVARVLGNKLYILSDSKITDETSILKGNFKGALKSIILAPELCICFAGLVYPALSVIREANDYYNKTNDINQIIKMLFDKSQKFDNQIDFIVAYCKDRPEIHTIKNGEIKKCEVAWIGDIDAFNEYQQNYSEYSSTPITNNPNFSNEIQTQTLMYLAFSKTLNSTKCKSIDQPQISVMTEEKGFNYSIAVNIFAPAQTIPSGIETKINFGNVQNGGYGYTILVPDETGIGLIGVHFYPGNVGAIFYPLFEDSVIRYKNVTPNELIEIVKKDFGIRLQQGIKIG